MGSAVLYLALFEYLDESLAEPLFGHFTYLIESDCIDNASQLIKLRLKRLHEHDNLFVGVKSIFVRSIVEIQQVPREGLMAFVQSGVGERALLACDFPIEEQGCRVFSPLPNGSEPPEDLSNAKPFLVFGE
jgi:hypothetical protein